MTKQVIKTIVVDDEPLARKGLRARLERHDDVQVLAESQNGLEAVSSISQHRPDLVFLDIQMPGLNGFQVIHKLRELKQPIPMGSTSNEQQHDGSRATNTNSNGTAGA